MVLRILNRKIVDFQGVISKFNLALWQRIAAYIKIFTMRYSKVIVEGYSKIWLF